MTDLRTAAQQALEALELGYDSAKAEADQYHAAMAGYRQQRHDQMDADVQQIASAITALRAALAEPVQEPVECEPQYANDDGWCDWVCPKPVGYLMQCCDCGLIHEVESRVAKYEPHPSGVFEVSDDPDLQVQWRMKRRDDISPKQAPQRPAEPVAWRFEARHIDSAWAAAVTLKHPGPEGVYMRNVTPLYTSAPQRKPLTEQEIWDAVQHGVVGGIGLPSKAIAVAGAIERAHGITS